MFFQRNHNGRGKLAQYVRGNSLHNEMQKYKVGSFVGFLCRFKCALHFNYMLCMYLYLHGGIIRNFVAPIAGAFWLN